MLIHIEFPKKNSKTPITDKNAFFGIGALLIVVPKERNNNMPYQIWEEGTDLAHLAFKIDQATVTDLNVICAENNLKRTDVLRELVWQYVKKNS